MKWKKVRFSRIGRRYFFLHFRFFFFFAVLTLLTPQFIDPFQYALLLAPDRHKILNNCTIVVIHCLYLNIIAESRINNMLM